MLDYELKLEIVEKFIENAKTWQRQNAVTEYYHDIIYDKSGNYTESGEEIANFIEKVSRSMDYLERKPVDYSLLMLLCID